MLRGNNRSRLGSPLRAAEMTDPSCIGIVYGHIVFGTRANKLLLLFPRRRTIHNERSKNYRSIIVFTSAQAVRPRLDPNTVHDVFLLNVILSLFFFFNSEAKAVLNDISTGIYRYITQY